MLEEIQRDLTEVKQSMDKCWKIMQELMEAHEGEQHHAEEDSQRVTLPMFTHYTLFYTIS
jgi:hypothetical protein